LKGGRGGPPGGRPLPHPCSRDSSHRSASMAARHPHPAAVTAWR
jgi:hypothetical protein